MCVATAFAAKAAPLPCVFPPPSRLRQRLCLADLQGAGLSGFSMKTQNPFSAGQTARKDGLFLFIKTVPFLSYKHRLWLDNRSALCQQGGQQVST